MSRKDSLCHQGVKIVYQKCRLGLKKRTTGEIMMTSVEFSFMTVIPFRIWCDSCSLATIVYQFQNIFGKCDKS